MRLIDGDALEREGWSLCRTFQKDKDTMVYEVKKPSDFPAIEPERTGKWIRISPAKIYERSICGKNVMTADIDEYHFCHGCGARMES